MASLDIFEDDAFSVTSLTNAINDTPHQPGRIGELGWFDEEGIATTTAMIEREGGVISLVPVTARGAPPTPVGADKRRMFPIASVHLPQSGAIYADEIQGIRAFGKESEVQVLERKVRNRFAKMRRDIDTTLEWQRVGAIKGQILDADGTTVLWDMFDLFDLTQQTANLKLSDPGTKVRTACVGLKRRIGKTLGGVTFRGMRALCSPSFIDAFVDHEEVVRAWDNYQNNSKLQDDLRGGFKFADIFWEEYEGSIGGKDFIEDGYAYLVPEGVVDMFLTKFAPADYMETVNTEGFPYYAKQAPMRMNKGVELEAQSNPIQLCTRPDAIIKIKMT